jgi:hypothetical protein
MAAIRITREDQADVQRIITEGEPRILIGQLVAYKSPEVGFPQLFEVDSYDRHTDTFVLQHPVTKVKLRSRALPSELHIGERSRGDENPILELLEGVEINPAPHLIRRPIRGFRASPPRSPDRATEPRRRARAPSPSRFPGAPAYAPPVGGPPAAMSPAALMSGPLAGARGPPPMGPGSPFPPPGSDLCLPGGLSTTPSVRLLQLLPLIPLSLLAPVQQLFLPRPLVHQHQESWIPL